MQYAELNYTEKRNFEKTLTPAQRGKMRKMEKEHQEQIQPIGWASHKAEDEARREAYKTLRIAERIKELEAEKQPRLLELRAQFEAIQNEINKIQNEINEKRTDIQVEAYQAASNDPQVKTLQGVWRQIKDAQKIQFQKLVDSFEVKVNA